MNHSVSQWCQDLASPSAKSSTFRAPQTRTCIWAQVDAGLNIDTVEGVLGYSGSGQYGLRCGTGFLLLAQRARLSPALARQGRPGGESSLSPPFHSPASLVTAITKGCSALGDTDLSQPTKPESCMFLTSPWGLGVTVHSLPGVAWDSPPGDRRLHLLHEVRKHRFLPAKN